MPNKLQAHYRCPKYKPIYITSPCIPYVLPLHMESSLSFTIHICQILHFIMSVSFVAYVLLFHISHLHLQYSSWIHFLLELIKVQQDPYDLGLANLIDTTLS